MHRDAWRGDDDSHCHALATRLRALDAPVQAIRYESARREGGMCQVVFDVNALAIPDPGLQQTWTCKTTQDRVLLSHDADRLQFDMGMVNALPAG